MGTMRCYGVSRCRDRYQGISQVSMSISMYQGVSQCIKVCQDYKGLHIRVDHIFEFILSGKLKSTAPLP